MYRIKCIINGNNLLLCNLTMVRIALLNSLVTKTKLIILFHKWYSIKIIETYSHIC